MTRKTKLSSDLFNSMAAASNKNNKLEEEEDSLGFAAMNAVPSTLEGTLTSLLLNVDQVLSMAHRHST